MHQEAAVTLKWYTGMHIAIYMLDLAIVTCTTDEEFDVEETLRLFALMALARTSFPQLADRDAPPPSAPPTISLAHASAPIHTLPQKILLAIFKYFLPLARACPICKTSVASAEVRPLITISHVCSLWRRLVLGQPTFWSYVDGCSGDLCRAFLQRSQSIQISLRSSTEPLERLKSILIAHGRRIWRLDLEAPTRDCENDQTGGVNDRKLRYSTVTHIHSDGSRGSCVIHPYVQAAAITFRLCQCSRRLGALSAKRLARVKE
ncbi:hypothetical protein BV20DRAFT_1117075 [Pilatotrama ljubarskyi]|nr:hypothetical protein BV20DRAFT_1117075 [Pilatotrama ljubarskyi]